MGKVASARKKVCIYFTAFCWKIILIFLIVLDYVCQSKRLTNMWKKLINQFVAERDQFTNSGKQLTKKLIDRWKELNNAWKVFCAGIGSIILGFLLLSVITAGSSKSIIEGSAGFWNFIILIVSAPVAFVIWHFRDENNRQQIENQRKDINLKEFQKLSEWVSDAHLPEIKTVSKTTQKSSLKDGEEITEQTTEQSEEYAKKPDTAHFDTFSKRDGAIALQISAIYNLLPFFRGDYGESFRRPAFNLLKSAWQAMQFDSLQQLEDLDSSNNEKWKIIDKLRQRAESPMGVALTHVLLSLNQENTKLNLHDFPEMLPNICLAGIDFAWNSVSTNARDLSKLNLIGANFQKAMLVQAKFRWSKLNYAKLDGANLLKAELQNAILELAELERTNLQGVHLVNANLQGAYLGSANLESAVFEGANLKNAHFNWIQLKKSAVLLSAQITVLDFIKNIYPDWKEKNDSEWDALTEEDQTKAMQKFCDETGMLIFDEDGEQQIMPPPLEK